MRPLVCCPFLGRRGMESTVLESPCERGATRHATAGGIRAWHATRGLATRSRISGGTTLQRCRFVSKVERSRGGEDLVQGLHSPRARRVAPRHWSPNSSGCSSSVACTSIFLCPRASAGVANHTTLVATTGQLARGLGSWGGAGTHWRASPLVFAARLVPG